MITKKVFGGKQVQFDANLANGTTMVNATQMAKIFGKRIDHFLKSDHAQAFIEELEFTPYGGNSTPLKRDEIIQTRGTAGTWMHRVLALKFAAWLDTKFEIWVYSTIEEILFGYSREQDKSIRRAVLLTRQLAELEKKPDKTGEDFEMYMKLDQQLKNERSLRAQNTKARFREIYRALKPVSTAN